MPELSTTTCRADTRARFRFRCGVVLATLLPPAGVVPERAVEPPALVAPVTGAGVGDSGDLCGQAFRAELRYAF